MVVSEYHRGGATRFVLRAAGEPQFPKFDKHNMPRLLFLSAGGMTLATLLLLWWQMPGLFGRTRLWFRWLRRCRLEPVDTFNLPADGAAILATNADSTDACLQVVSATDRQTYFVMPAAPSGGVEPAASGAGPR